MKIYTGSGFGTLSSVRTELKLSLIMFATPTLSYTTTSPSAVGPNVSLVLSLERVDIKSFRVLFYFEGQTFCESGLSITYEDLTMFTLLFEIIHVLKTLRCFILCPEFSLFA